MPDSSRPWISRVVPVAVAAAAVLGIVAGADSLTSHTQDTTKTSAFAEGSAPAPAADPALAARGSAAATALKTALVYSQEAPVPASAGTQPGRHPAARELTDMVTRADGRLTSVFSGQALEKERSSVRSAAARLQQPDLLSLGAGADTFAFDPPAFVDAHTITYTGSYRSWAKVAQVQEDGKIVPATPSNILLITATLTDASGTWKVDSLDWSFAPGSAP